MGFKAKVTLLVLAIVGAAGGLGYWLWGGEPAPSSQLIKGKVERGTIRISVTATGTLEAVKTVQVGSQISGQISALKQGSCRARLAFSFALCLSGQVRSTVCPMHRNTHIGITAS